MTLLLLFPSGSSGLCAPGNLLSGTSAVVQRSDALVKEEACPASSILCVSAAAHHFLIAITY